MPGFVDHHTHLLQVAAGVMPPWEIGNPGSIEAFHRQVAARGSTPMDEAAGPVGVADLPAAMTEWLTKAADMGIVSITEAGMRDWAHWDAVEQLRGVGPLPTRVRVMVASGSVDLTRMAALRSDDEWLRIIGVKFYADGWLGPRTCACSQPFADRPDDDGVLFMDAATLAGRVEGVAAEGWSVATHAIGDRAIETVLDAYESAYGGAAGVRQARPRIEHAQVLRTDLIARMADLGVTACIQPCFRTSDEPAATEALAGRWPEAYRWDLLLDAGVDVIAGSDFPIESLDPEAGLAGLTTGPHALDKATAMRLMTEDR
ncbi:MAG: amidohydrolase family protein [Acidimicrobiales bacterium]